MHAGLLHEPSELADATGVPDGRNSDFAWWNGRSIVIGEHPDGVEDGGKIVHGFAHAHEDDVRDRRAELVCGMVPLGDNLSRCELPHAAHRSGLAEGAAHGASDLA